VGRGRSSCSATTACVSYSLAAGAAHPLRGAVEIHLPNSAVFPPFFFPIIYVFQIFSSLLFFIIIKLLVPTASIV
jgi:hypothetical protein